MVFLSVSYYIFLAAAVMVYYLLPLRFRWLALLAASMAFYVRLSHGRKLFFAMVLFSYAMGLFLYYMRKKRAEKRREEGGPRAPERLLFAAAVCAVAAPLVVTKNGNFILESFLHRPGRSFIIPLGLSFYTLQMIAYLADIFTGRIEPEKNPFHYMLFISFFPQTIQGPIPRFGDLGRQLFTGHRFDEAGFTRGLLLIGWGFFLKMMIADKAAVVVNAVFDHSAMYAGFVVFAAGALYSLQLYADFMACVSMAKGAAALFGVQLAENFNHPYLALSIKEFWQRWHISLSSWLRDYIYIPLGGSRKGRLRHYINLALTFAVSGVWHGAGCKYLFWGLFHAAYQIVEEITAPVRDRLCRLLGISEGSFLRTALRRAAVLFPFMASGIVFRADSLREGLWMLSSMVSVWNPWILFDDTLLRLGLEWKEWAVLLISSWVLLRASLLKERRGLELWDWLMQQHILFRWFCYLGAAVAVFVFGTYGFGFDAQAFIYGGF